MLFCFCLISMCVCTCVWISICVHVTAWSWCWVSSTTTLHLMYSLLHVSIYSFIHYLWMSVYAHKNTLMNSCQKTAWRSWFSPFTVWVPKTELRSLGLTASTLTHWAIWPSCHLIFWNSVSHWTCSSLVGSLADQQLDDLRALHSRCVEMCALLSHVNGALLPRVFLPLPLTLWNLENAITVLFTVLSASQQRPGLWAAPSFHT